MSIMLASDDGAWTVDETDNLIMCVRDRREIYDQSLPGYSNRDRTDTLWREIANKIKTKNAKQCRNKWQILRGSYRSKRNEYVPSGSGRRTTKKWAYFQSMTFLNPYIAERKRHSNIYTQESTSESTQSTTNEDSQISEENSQVWEDFDVDHDGSLLNVNVTPESSNETVTPEFFVDVVAPGPSSNSNESDPLFSSTQSRKKLKKDGNGNKHLEDVMIQYFKNKSNVESSARPTHNSDLRQMSPIRLFLTGIANMAEQKLDFAQQISLQMQILQIMNEFNLN